MKTVAVLMAGGKSSRMGSDKALMSIGSRPLVSILAERWQGVFDALVLSVDHTKRFAHLGLDGIQMVEDARPGGGPMAGLETIMGAIPADRYFLIAVDLPFSSPSLAHVTCKEIGNSDVCLIRRRNGRLEPLFALYSRRCFPHIAASLGRGERSFQHGLFPHISVREITEDRGERGL